MRPCLLAWLAAALSLAPAYADGKARYEALCAGCHGADGRGGERGPEIVSSQRTRARSEETLRSLIRAGIPEAGMPGFALSDVELAELVGYIKQLSAPGKPKPPDYERVSIRLRDGRRLSGLVRNQSDFDLQLQSDEGVLVSLRRGDVVELRSHGRGTVPELKISLEPRGGRPGEWPTYNGDPRGNRHSPLREIHTGNVTQFAPRWIFTLRNSRRLEVTPVVIDEVMYVTAGNEAYALDAATGREIWHYQQPRTRGVVGDAAGGINRGVAVLGDLLFLVTDHAHLIALDRRTGRLVWDVEMADYRDHYGATSAPLVVKNLVISGHSGGDEGVRGFLAAYHAATGARAWRFWTVPAPGEPLAETWKGKVLPRGCAATWLTGSYDPDLDLLYWTTGNPCPDFNGDERQGDNLYSNSVLALRPDDGKLVWHYQLTPHDLHDWDATEPVLLIDAPFRGRIRKLLVQANRNGFFYVLDRASGELLLAKPFVRQLNWASGIGMDGRPQRLDTATPTLGGVKVCPSMAGATNWMSSAYNPATGLFYVMALEKCSVYTKSFAWFRPGESFYGGSARDAASEASGKYLRALDLQSGNIVWERALAGPGNSWGGVLSTAGGLVFFGDDSGALAAADARTGKPLWHFHTSELWKASPMTYLAGGRQYVAVASGPNILAFGLSPAP